jgi:GxxExxY protein
MASPPAKIRAIREIRGKNRGMKHEKLTGEIPGATMAVLNELKPGLDGRPYENALVIELAARGLSAEQQRCYPVYCRGHFIGQLVPDLIVNGAVIVDPKVVTAFNESHLAQMLGYLNITGLEVALLLNFKEANLAWKRVVRGPTEAETGSQPRITRISRIERDVLAPGGRSPG